MPEFALPLCRVEPLDYGIQRCTVEDLAGGDAALNASILSDVFGGVRGPVADALNLNAGVALAACEAAASPAEGVAMAQVLPLLPCMHMCGPASRAAVPAGHASACAAW